ncbi:MAG: CYTH domain-containing protein, partial [Tepidiformaceae bacterium]
MAEVADIIEVEWQFSAPDVQPVLQWLESAAVPGFTVAPGKTKQLDDTYYDTDDWRVHRAGFTCRTRQKSDGIELTLKSMASSVDAMRSRRELTEQLPDDIAGSPAAADGQC